MHTNMATYMCIKHTVGLPLRCNLCAGELKCNLGMWSSCCAGQQPKVADLQPEAEVCPWQGTSLGLETLILPDI